MSLPTLEKLGSTVDPDVDARVVAKEWFNSFKDVMIARDVSRILSLFVDDAFWRDMLSLTWDFHTYEGKVAINQFLSDQLPKFQPIALQLREDLTALEMPYRDIAWIQAFFAFDTVVGHASGIFRLVPLSDGSWKAHVVYTNLEDLKGFPEKIGFLRDHKPNHGKWHEIRKREQEFLDDDPSVVIVGGGHSGLDVAARLKVLGVKALVVEKNKRIGDNWRNRYDGLCLHDAIWRDHLPYLPEDGPSTDLADRISASFPNTLAVPLRQRTTRTIAEADKDFLDALRRVGFKTWLGPDDSGLLGTLATRIGTFYIGESP
ncbi:hypothetical protein ID866_6537 [Astraeus odoratus]|nr:hypothetical protein ID866_6537 [Astraeus odoratus]